MEKLVFPNRVTVELTNDCNVSCTFCNRRKTAMDIGYMDEKLFYRIMDEMAGHLPIKLVPFFRGEPLMHPQAIEFVKYAKERGIGPIQMASNGLLLDERAQDGLIEAGVDYLSFSLDTVDPEAYRRSRLSGDLGVSAGNVECMGLKCRERRKKGLPAPTLQVSTINTEEYMPRQKEFIERWLPYVDVVRVYEQHDEKGRLVSRQARERLGGLDGRKPCRKVFTDMIVCWDGRLALCNYDWEGRRDMELAYDEREKAEYMSYKFKTEHYEVVLKSGDMERCMEKLVWHMEDPRVGQSYPNFYAAKLSSNFVKVVLAGSGGDELFAGYPWRYYRAAGCRSFDEYAKNYFEYWQRLLKEDEMGRFFGPVHGRIEGYSTEAAFKSVFGGIPKKELSPQQSVNYSLYLEAKTFLHGLLLVEDKLSMAHGLETRVPFLDNDLVDFAMKVPVGLKLSKLGSAEALNENEHGSKTERYFERNGDGKIILRDAMRRYVPEEIAQGGKQGFSAPDASWFRGESIDYVDSVISNPDSLIYEYIDRECAQDALKRHVSGKENKRLLIWSVINFEEWLRLFMKGNYN